MPDDIDDDEPDPNEPPNIRQLRQANKALKADVKALQEAQSKADRLERELAIRDAGIDLTPKQRQALFSVHEGAFEPEAIKQTAVELGFVAPPVASEVPPEELARLQRIDQASAGARNTGTPVNTDMELNARLASARNDEEFMAIYRESGRPIAR